MFEKETTEYMTKHENMKYSVGQKMIVVDSGAGYSTYYDWVSDNKLHLSTNDKVRKLWSKYLAAERNSCEVGTKLTVIATGYNELSHVAMYLCEDSNGNPVLIGEEGLDTLEKEDTKMAEDLNEVFDVKSIISFQFDLLQKAYLKGLKTEIERLKTGIEIGKPEKDE